VTHTRLALGRAARGTTITMSQRTRIKIVTAALALVATSLVWSGGTFSAFNKTSPMPSNSVATGSVTLTDNDSGAAAFTLANAAPGSTTTNCVNVSYTGDIAAGVRLYGTIGGTGLASYVTVVVTRGTFSATPTAGSCTGFTADTGGQLYSGTLSAFPTTAGAALTDTVSWTNGTKRGYKFVVSLPAGTASAAQGLTASANFTWMAVSS
jgi:hypothetical protein